MIYSKNSFTRAVVEELIQPSIGPNQDSRARGKREVKEGGWREQKVFPKDIALLLQTEKS